MTEEQRELFVAIAKAGITCGLNHPFEWLVNWCRTLDAWAKYEEIQAKEVEAYECYVALYTETAPDFRPTIDDIVKMIDVYYLSAKGIIWKREKP